MIRHYCWAYNKFELVTGLSEDELRPQRVSKAVASETMGTSASTSTSRPPQTSSRSSPTTSRINPTTTSRRNPLARNSRVSITRVQEEEVQIEGETI